MRPSRIYDVVALLASLVSLIAVREDAAQFRSADAHIARLERIAGSYPAALDSKREFALAVRDLHSCVGELEALAAKGAPKWGVEWRIGECWRMGHNLDLPHAWEQAETHLKRAAALKPDEPRPYAVLGTLYVNSDLSLAPKAEEQFRRSLKLSGSKPLREAQEGLVFACYYQGKLAEANSAVEAALKSSPGNPKLLAIRKVIQDRLGDRRSRGP